MPQTTGPRVLAELKQKIVILPDYTGSLTEVPLSDLEDAIDVSCRAVAADTRYSATDSDTLTDSAVCEPANAQTLGASNAEGRLALFRYFDEENPGQYHEQYDQGYQAAKVKGTELVIVIRDTGKEWDEPFAAEDEIEVYRVTTDHPQKPQDRTGYQKRVIPTPVQDFRVNAVVTGSGGGGG